MAPRSLRLPVKKWATIHESPNAESYEVEVILVHDLHKKSDLREQLEMTVKDVCLAVGKSVEVSFRISVYRFNYKEIQDKGEFKESFTEILGQVQKLLDNNQHRSRRGSQSQVSRARQSSQLSPKILFITYELGAWLVRNLFFYKTSDLASSVFKDFENPVQRLAGIIFLGADMVDEHEGFEHSKYLEKRLAGTSNETPTWFIVDKLQSVDANFRKSLKRDSTGLASTIWILPALALSAPYQSSSSLHRTESGVSLLHRGKSLRNPFRSKSPRDTSRGLASLTKIAHNEDSRSDDTSPERPLEFSRRVLQDLVVACDVQNKSDQSSNSPDEFQYIKILKLPSMLGNSSRTEDSMNAAPHLSPRPPKPPRLQMYTSNESTGSGFQSGHEEMLPRSIPRSIPGTPLEWSSDHMSQLSLQSTRETMPTDHIDPMPEDYGRWETNTGSNTVDQNLTEVEENMSLAQSYLKRGDFDRAEGVYDKCADIIQKIEPLNNELALRVSYQKALIRFQKGDYMNTLIALQALWEYSKTHYPDLLEVDQIAYHLAVILTRLGDHHGAFQKLENLKNTTWFEQIQTSLESFGPLPQYILVDPRVEIVLSTSRLIALLWAYYGHYKKAKEMMATAEAIYARFLRARRKDRAPPSPGLNVPHEQGYLTVPQVPITDVTQRQPGKPVIDVRCLEATIYLARAKLSMLQGEDESALLSTRRTLRRLEKQLGRRHIMTLEAAALNALILARKFDGEAESVCVTAINAMTQNLGREHPLTMETLSTLVSIFLRQSRPYEARDTVAALLEQATEKLGGDNPQTLRYQCLLGEVDLYVGNYRKAKEELEDVCRTATNKWIDQEPLGQYPDVLRYLTKLAMASSCMEKSTDARELAEEVLISQARIYRVKIKEGEEPEDESVNSIFDKLGLGRDHGFGITPHPDVLDSLANYVSILDKGGYSRPEVVLETYELVYKLREGSHGAGHYLTLQSGLDFAFACLDNNERGRHAIGDLADFFRRRCDDCERYLGSNHIMTWRAKLGDLFNRGLEYGEARFKSELSKIMRGQTTLLGQSHPLVLDSLSRLFVVQLMLHDNAAHGTADLLLTQVRQRNIREQRLMETLQVEEKVAEMYCAIQCYEQGLPIFEKIARFLDKNAEEYDKDGYLEDERKSFGTKLQGARGRARQAAEDLRNQLLLSEDADPFSSMSYDEAESVKRRVASLSRSLYRESRPETVNALRSLAEFLHSSKDIQKRDEGLHILGDLRASIWKAMLKNKGGDKRLYDQLTAEYDAWQDEAYRNAGQDWQADYPDTGQEQAEHIDYFAPREGKGKGREE